jgi:hypothetical protein
MTWSNSVKNVINIAAGYLKSTHPLRMLWHLIWIFVLLVMLSASYIITFHFRPVIELWQASRSLHHFRTELNTALVVDQAINSQLALLMDQTQGHRAYLFRYHNGVPSVNGVPFMFHTNTHEVIRAGVARVIQFNQRLPSGINVAMNQEFARRRCVSLRDLDSNRDGANHWYYQTRGAVAMIRCAVYTREGDVVGFVGVDYLDPTSESQLRTAEISVQAVAMAVSQSLDRRSP